MSEDLSPEDAELFDLLEQYAPLVAKEPEQRFSVLLPRDVLQRHPELPGMLRCMASLEDLSDRSTDPETRYVRGPSPPGNSSIRALRSLGPYELEEELGRGGMGVVYRARHVSLKATFAVKLIRSSEWASDAEVHRFYREARAAAGLQHPNIVRVHDVGEQDGIHYLAMQHMLGGSLADQLRSHAFAPDEAVRMLHQIALAVDYLHHEGIIHRDLKPANILLDREGIPYVTDFGLAKAFDQDETGTASGMIVGTPAYMAPEQAWGDGQPPAAACDIYSLGAIFYELLTGRPPYAEASPLDQLLRLRDSEPIPPRRLKRSIPRELEQICLRCLERSPTDRYPSAAALADDLRRYLEREPIQLPALDWLSQFQRWVRREPALVARLVGFLVLALILSWAEFNATERRAPYIPVMSALLVWTLTCVGLQRMLTHDLYPRLVRGIWVLIDVAIFTTAVSFAEGPVESLAVGYSLLIVAASFWYQPSLVWMMTGASCAAYLVLLTIRGATGIPPHYPFIVVGELLVVGGIVASLVRQIRDLLHRRTMQQL
ncbi:MAG: serine/threonine protein kinase [Planctomycetaceae bacterium]|nr:serine/threonine protein kinase [Planctomycetaceae bacterium]